ncbi:hypothetical protein CRG98_027654 [Punica granatum]|uniref:Cupin type-1 domain-containing protein n=1 Tax=Punica granatum TaxID=22663 RepID=A0A2I0J710_PUNGR|nr:hypothetical protein CRG98_027654 [Punica granatum]
MRTPLWLLLLVVAVLLLIPAESYGRRGRVEEEEEEEEEWRGGRRGYGRGEGEDLFLLQDSTRVVQTDAGEMRVVRTFGGRIIERPMHIGFITMEPKSLFIPQYLDSSLIIFVRRGEAKLGTIYKDELLERWLKIGDVFRIPAGSAFYLINTGETQRLHIICSIDASESLGLRTFQSFFIGGGTYPTSVLTGFDPETLATAFNVSRDEVTDFLTSQQEGPIVYVNDSAQPSVWTKFLQLKKQDRLQHLKRMEGSQELPEEEGEAEQQERSWSWRKLLPSLFGSDNAREDRGRRRGKAPDSYNLYDRKPDFRNNYGWSVALHESDYEPLRHSGIGVYLVNLTAGSMMAPHVNPTATEYAIVLRGSGTIQIAYPNGSSALKAKVSEGDIFWVPRYFPFCQISSRTGPFEFFGFTTSARKNRPQFLAGQNSLLHVLRGPELAASLGSTDDRVRSFLDAQREAVILPSPSAAPPDEAMGEENRPKMATERVENVARSIANEMVVGFD